MKTGILVFALVAAAATSAHADSRSYAQCGTYDSYLLIYKTTDRFEELGKLRCDEAVDVLGSEGGYSQIRTGDGRIGWVRTADLADAPPPPHRTFTFGLTEQIRDTPSKPAPARDPALLTNEDVLAMHTQHSGSELIVKKIATSRCDFDMSPEAFRVLKTSGLPDTVILAMLAAPVSSAGAAQKTSEVAEMKIPDGTSVEVQLAGNVLSEEAREGTIVEMTAAEDLVVNGVPVILRGSPARARIVAVERTGSNGDSGKVAWFMQDIVAINGDHIPVTFAAKQPDNNRTRNFEGYSFFVSEFPKGSPAIKATDKHFRVVLHGAVLRVPQSVAADVPAPKTDSPSVRQVASQVAAPADSASPSPQASQLSGTDESQP